MNTASAPAGRLLSLDALRGFDMFFIMGGAELVAALATLFPCAATEALAGQMGHTAWNGLTFYDTIFPLFLFVAGISFPFSLAKQQAAGGSRAALHRKVARRGIALVLLGIVYNGLLSFDFEHLRCASVLGRIGLGWMLAALIFMHTRTRTRLWLTPAILAAYWALMAFVPVPGAAGADPFSPEGSWTGYVDRRFLPGTLHDGVHDPEGLLSTVPAVATALLGMLAGELVRLRRPGLTEGRKVCALLLAGAVLLLAGLAWSLSFPVNKNLWSSSFVCIVGAYSFWIFALFYWVIDVLRLRRWTFFFAVIGTNSIAIYLAQQFVDFWFTANALFGGLVAALPEASRPLAAYAAYVAVCWGFLYVLHRQRIFLKV